MCFVTCCNYLLYPKQNSLNANLEAEIQVTVEKVHTTKTDEECLRKWSISIGIF
jgi:hypothetical protein